MTRRASQPFDWQEIRQRFESLHESSAQASELTPEQAEAVMVQRAQELARVPQEAPDTSDILEVMIVCMGGERFALETSGVREVQRIGHVTPIPDAPEFLLGVTNLRGDVLAVTDLRSFFGLGLEKGDRTQLIVLGSERPEFGILVDQFQEVTRLRIDEILTPPGSVSGVGREYLRGVTEDALLVLDLDAVLADERLYMDERD